jgi:hypothetical protein
MIARRRRSGFAMVIAIMLMGIVAVTLGCITTTFTLDAQRTRTQAQAAQLRQLLVAGALIAQTHLSESNDTQAINVPLPAGLNSRAALGLQFEPTDPSGQRIVIVAATVGNRRLTQRLQFIRQTRGWSLVAAEMGT